MYVLARIILAVLGMEIISAVIFPPNISQHYNCFYHCKLQIFVYSTVLYLILLFPLLRFLSV